MPPKKKVQAATKTQVVTNTQIAVAAIAMFLAGGLAFAAAPSYKAKSEKSAKGTTTSHYLSCVDTDDGHNVYEQGTVVAELRRSGRTLRATDVCGSPDQLAEYYCDGTTPRKTVGSCPEGNTCFDGACVPVTTSTGELLIAIVNSDTRELQHNRYELAGDDHILGRLRISANDADIEIRDLAVELQADFSDTLIEHITGVELVTASGSGEPLSVLRRAPFSVGEVVFEDVGLLHLDGGRSDYFIRLTTDAFGPVFSSSTSSTIEALYDPFVVLDLPTDGGATDAIDIATGIAAPVNVDTSDGGQMLGIVPAMITDVRSSDEEGIELLTGGNDTYFEFSITADAGDNRTIVTYTPFEVRLDYLKMYFNSNIDPDNFDDFELCNAATDDCIDLAFEPHPEPCCEYMYRLATGFRGEDGLIRLLDFEDDENRIISSGETLTYELRGTIDGPIEDDNFFQASVRFVDDGALQWGYDYLGYGYRTYVLFDTLFFEAPRPAYYPIFFGPTFRR